jgi:hypothetical protein
MAAKQNRAAGASRGAVKGTLPAFYNRLALRNPAALVPADNALRKFPIFLAIEQFPMHSRGNERVTWVVHLSVGRLTLSTAQLTSYARFRTAAAWQLGAHFYGRLSTAEWCGRVDYALQMQLRMNIVGMTAVSSAISPLFLRSSVMARTLAYLSTACNPML